VLQTTFSDKALNSAKVGLGDLFEVKSKDPSEFRIYRNKIDRKHVDFLLCDPKTLRRLQGLVDHHLWAKHPEASLERLC
jgi:hypothetical protein